MKTFKKETKRAIVKCLTPQSTAINQGTEALKKTEWDLDFFSYLVNEAPEHQALASSQHFQFTEELQNQLSKSANSFEEFVKVWDQLNAKDRLSIYKALIFKEFPEPVESEMPF